MKTFFDFLKEQTRIYPDTPKVKQFGDDTKMKLLGIGVKPPEENPNRPVDTTGANSPFADKSVKSYTVTPDKPLVGKDNAVKRALAAKGYDETGRKINKPTTRTFPDNPPQKQFGQDTKMKMLSIDRKITSDTSKTNEPVKTQMRPKVGSLSVKQSGYPAAKKPTLAPAESQKASSGGSYKVQSGDNPSKIAKNLGMSLQDLEKKNPGIIKRARKLKIGGTINR